MYSIGIDIGGTNIKGAMLGGDQTLLLQRAVPFPGADRPGESIGVIAGLVQTLLDGVQGTVSDVLSIGLAVPGSIDYETQQVIDAYNLGYHRFPIVSLLRSAFPGLPIQIENDANAAALGEYGCGALKGKSSGLLITLGTGVGGGLILNDRLFTGGRRHGFEFGHMILRNGGERCTCGNLGCVEAYCSATALIRGGKRAAERRPDSALNRAGSLPFDAKWVIQCARAGDPDAMGVFEAYVQHLGAALVSAINLFDPDVIAIGGGVSNAGDDLIVPLSAYADAHAFFRCHTDIVRAQLGGDAGVIGAAMLHQHGAC